MAIREFYDAFKNEINTNGSDHVKQLFAKADIGPLTLIGGHYSSGNWLVDGWYNHVITNTTTAGGIAALNLSTSAGPATAGHAMLGVTMNGTAVANGDVDDWRDAAANAGVDGRYNSAEAGIVCAKLSSAGWNFMFMQVADRTLSVGQYEKANNAGAAVTGSREILAIGDNHALFRTAVRNALNAIPAVNIIRNKATDEEINEWYNWLIKIKSTAGLGAGNQGGINPTGPATNGPATNEELRVNQAAGSLANWAIKIAWIHNSGWDPEEIEYVNGGGVNHSIRVAPAVSPTGNAIIGSFNIATARDTVVIGGAANAANAGVGAAANGAVITPLLDSKFPLFRVVFQTTVSGILGGGSARAGEVDNSLTGIAKLKEWLAVLKKLREATATGTTKNANVAGTAVENWRKTGYTNLNALDALARIFAAGWEADDISLSSTNDIEVAATKSPDGKQKLGTNNIIKDTKQVLLIARAKTHNDLGSNWSGSATASILNLIFDNDILNIAGNPKDSCESIKKAQTLFRQVQEADARTTFDSSLWIALTVAKGSPAGNTSANAYAAVNNWNNCVDTAIEKLNLLKKDSSSSSSSSSSTGDEKGDRSAERGYTEFRREATVQLNNLVGESKKVVNPTTATAADLPKIKEQITKLKEFKNNTSNFAGQQGQAFAENVAAKSWLEELEKKEKELSGGTTPPPTEEKGKEEKGKEEKGKEEKGKEEKEESKKTVESVRADIINEFKETDKKKVESALKALAKDEKYSELKSIKSMEEAVKKFNNVEKLEQFQSAFRAKVGETQTGFKAHIAAYWYVYGLVGLLALGAIAYFFFMKKPSEKEVEEEE